MEERLDVTTTPAKPKTIKWYRVIGAMFAVGLAMGACTLGMKLPVALFDLATGN